MLLISLFIYFFKINQFEIYIEFTSGVKGFENALDNCFKRSKNLMGFVAVCLIGNTISS